MIPGPLAHLSIPGMPAAGTPLCRLDELPESGTKGFVFGSGTERCAIFIVWREGMLRAYVNDCPHAHSPLDWVPDRFLDRDETHLLCATHGAKFRIPDGRCISGPCKGKSLTPVPVYLANDSLFVGPAGTGS